MTFLAWTSAFGGSNLREEAALEGLKDGLLRCLFDGGPDCDFLKVRIRTCRNRGQLILARADVMQFLSQRLGEEVAASRLKGVWEHDPWLRQLQGAIPGRHVGAQRPTE